MSDSAYYRNRAVCRKILAEGTGIVVARMDDRALHERLDAHLRTIIAHAIDANITYPPLARAVVEIEEIAAEIYMRGVQLELPLT